MLKKNKISIITPVYNSEKYVEETIRTVISNSAVVRYQADLEYIIIDGISSDNTVQIIEKIFSSIEQKNIKTILISEKDKGMYDALAKGLQLASGNIISYINAGDLYSPNCFEIATEIFSENNIKWLTGLDVVYNEKSHLIYSSLPFKYRKSLIQCGFYNLKKLPHIQQESTFWDASLNDLIDYRRLRQFKYAGDFYLWNMFASIEHLYIVEAWLGGFKVHKGQLSSDADRYNKELMSIVRRPKLMDFLQAHIDKLIWNRPTGLKKILNRKTLFSFNHESQKYELPNGS